MAMKPGQSSKLEAMIGFEDCVGSKSSPLGVERFEMVGCSMRKVKSKIFLCFYNSRYTGKLGSEITPTTIP
jgi:hypothetical protein